MNEPVLSEVIGVAARFRRSASVEADYGHVELLTDYIASPLAVEVTSRICREITKSPGNRAWTLVGPYGSGKSSFLTFLASCFSIEDALRGAAFKALHRTSRVALSEISRTWTLLNSKFLIPVIITGSRRPLGPALLRGLLLAGERCLPKDSGTDILERLRATLASRENSSNGELVTDLMVAFSEQAQRAMKRVAGVLILIDEMGKFLEYAAQNPVDSDIYLLQQVAEAAARVPGAGLSILTVLHKDFDAYALGLTATAQSEWTKVRGRYETITFQESAGHLLKLIAHAIDHRAGATQIQMFQAGQVVARAEAVNVLAKGATPERARTLEACFPLNPVTALCLGPLFRLQLGQNERTLFSFLGSSEPGGFQSYLNTTDGNREDRPYCLDHLYDYVMNNTSARAGGAGRARIWAATEEAIHRLPKDAGSLDERILKALAVLTVTREGAGMDASKHALAAGLNEELGKVEERLKRLREASIIVYRKYRQGYQVWDGSDLDIEALISEASEPVRKAGGLADHIQRLLPAFPMVASRHYHQRGTLRYFEARYVGPDQISGTASGHGDGTLLYVVPDSEDQLAEAETRALALSHSRRERPVVIVLPGEVSMLVETAIELLAVQFVLGNTPDLDGDPVARREIEERRAIALERLVGAIARSFGDDQGRMGGQWFHDGELWEVNGRPSAVASTIFDKVYCDCPRILNELVNREELSSAAAAARHTLAKLMLTSSDKPSFGILGHPPELSLYRSVLFATGLHRLQDESWTLCQPLESGVIKVFERIRKRLAEAKGSQVTFADLMEELRKPPFGVRSGVSLILIFAWYLLHEEAVFLYEDSCLIPMVGDDLVHRLLRAPRDVAIQMPLSSRGAEAAVCLLADRLQVRKLKGKGEGIFDVVRRIIQVIKYLSPYALQTRDLSKEAIQVRLAITAAKDPVRLLWTELPGALGYQSFDKPSMSEPGQAERFATSLLSALSELQGADRALMRRVERTLRDLLRFDEQGADFFTMVQVRARAVSDFKDFSNTVQRWVDLSKELDPISQESTEIWLNGVATLVVGKAPRAWQDTDLPRFAQGAMELCRAYLSAEELALERRKAASGSFRMIRVSVLDSEGNDHSGVAMLRQEDAEKVSKFREQLRMLAAGYQIAGRELAYAVIADMMDEITRTSEEGALHG